MLKKLAAVFLIMILVLTNIIMAAATETEDEEEQALDLYARSAVLMDADTGRILYSKDGYEKMAMASTTKIMTCIIALEYGNLDDVVTVSANAAKMPDVQLNIRAGETYYLKDLLYSLMLESHNDVAVAIAEHIGGSVEGFAELMNQKARDLKALDTHFVTPNGLDAPGHETTAADLAMIASYAIKNEEFLKITNTQSYSFTSVDGKRSFSVNNKNQFLRLMDGAIGVKTGFTGDAGYCFVGAVQRDNKTFVSVVLGSGWPPNKSYKWHDTKLLMNYGLGGYEYKVLFEPVESLKKLYVNNGQIPEVDTYIEGHLSMLVGNDEKVDYVYEMPKTLEAPVEKDSIIGFVNITINGETYCKFPIKAKDTVKKIDYKYCLQIILNRYLLK